MNRSRAILAFALVAVVLVSAFVAFQIVYFIPRTKGESPFYLGIEFGYGNASDCKALVDKVKNYTNLLVISSTNVTQNEGLLNETCDYAYNAGMHIIVYFPQSDPIFSPTGGGSYHSYLWAMAAKEKYGPYFLGCYIYDEPGGEVLDRASGAVNIYYTSYSSCSYSTTPDYKSAATNFIANVNNQMGKTYLFCAQNSGTAVLTADYGLYWFDYKAGYNTVLAEFGWGNNRQMAIALCRGAATAQNKDWGAMICWESRQTGSMESGPALYDDLMLAYTNGAKYAVIFDYAGKNDTQNQDLPNPYTYGILTDEHFTALQSFWQYVQKNPDKHGSVEATTALVLPANYGFGFRSADDKIWGLDQSDNWTSKVWSDANSLLSQYKGNLDIVYNDSQFEPTVAKSYRTLISWTTGATGSDFRVVNVNSTLGYLTIQQAISSGATASGDTLLVKSGTYRENLVLSKSVVLLGEDKQTTIIDANNNGSALTITAPNVTLSGFTIKNGNFPSIASTTNFSTASIAQIITQMGYDPNYLSSLSPASAQTLVIQLMQLAGINGVQAPLTKAGVYLSNADNCSLTNNIITNCTYGILIKSSANTVMHNNVLADNQYSLGVSPLTTAQFNQEIDNSNTVDGKPVYYWIGKDGLAVPSDAGYVALINCTSITAENLQLSHNYNGLLVINTQDSSIKSNTLTNNYEGLTVANSTNNSVTNNVMSDNIYNLAGSSAPSSDIDPSNTVNGKPIYIWSNQHDKTVPANAGYVALIGCSGITVQGLNLTGNDVGIFLQNTEGSTIAKNMLTRMERGIQLSGGSKIDIANNSISGVQDGIFIDSSSYNRVFDNLLSGNQNSGITLQSSTNTSILDNIFNGNGQAVTLVGSSGNLLKGNAVTANTYGLNLSPASATSYTSSQPSTCTENSVVENNFTQNSYGVGISYNVGGNIFYHNNFFNNTQQAQSPSYSSTPTNTWDDGSSGNYWSNYNGTDANHDGVGDQPMFVFQQYQQFYSGQPPPSYYGILDQDRFPLMNPYVSATA